MYSGRLDAATSTNFLKRIAMDQEELLGNIDFDFRFDQAPSLLPALSSDKCSNGKLVALCPGTLGQYDWVGGLGRRWGIAYNNARVRSP